MAFTEEAYRQQLAAKGLKAGNTGAGGGFASNAVFGKPVPQQTEVIKPSGLPGIVQKGLDVGKQVANVGTTIGTSAAKFVAHTGIDVAKQAISTVKSVTEYQGKQLQNTEYAKLGDQLSRQQDAVVRAYKSGKISKEDYTKSLLSLSKANAQLSKESIRVAAGPSPVQRASDLANTAVNALTLGSFTTGKALGEQATKGLVSKLESTITKVPAARALAERNAQKITQTVTGETFDQSLRRQGKNVAVGLLIKRPIFYQTNVEGGKGVYQDIMKGDYPAAAKSAAWLGTQMLEGGPIGAFLKGASLIKGKVGKLAYGTGSFIDEISKQIGDGNPSQIARFLTTIEKKSPKEFEEANKVFKILQETNLRTADNNVEQAVSNVMTHYSQHGIPLENLTPSQIYKDFSNWAKADELAQKTIRQGVIKDVPPEDAQKYVVVRWDTPTKNAVADTVEKAGVNPQAQRDALNELADRPGVGWANNDILRTRLNEIIGGSGTPQEKAKAIREITTASTILSGVPETVAKELSDLGYSIAAPAGWRRVAPVGDTDLRKLITGAIKGDSKNFDIANAPEPNLAALAGALDKSGLSPRAANQTANRVLSESVVANLDELGMGSELGLISSQGRDLATGGKVILSKLQQYVENKRPVLGLGRNAAITDIRQLTTGEIQEALGVTSTQAKNISRAIMRGYTEVPLEFRGLGDKVVDNLYKFNPLQKYYSRLQSAMRYTYNPFFRTQERVETKLLSHLQANNLVWSKSREILNEGARQLDDAGIFTSSLPGEAAQDLVLGRITANITQAQKRDLAGLAMDMAKSRGTDLQDMINNHADELDDALRVVVQYPNKGVLASSLARTLNLAFFPVRYNTKVTLLAAKALAKQPPSVQVAMVHSLLTMKDWLKSDEGIKWQSEHADAIQLFQWLTPVNSIQATMNLLGHKPNSVSDLGQLGGLPLGLISQILDGQGIIKLNTPYVNPKTGDVFPDYIPESGKARAATALTDLLGTTFTYPGRILGLPGKEATMKKVVKAFIDTNGTDFEKNIDTDRLTPLQKQWIKVLKGDTSEETIDSLYNSPAPGSYQGYTLPPLNLPYKVVAPVTKNELIKRRGLPTGKNSGKKAKNLAIPIAQPVGSSLNTP